MIDICILLLFFAGISCKNFYVTLFAVFATAHNFLFANSEGYAYYFSAVLFDYLIVLLVNRRHFIQFVALSSISLNIFGAFIWFFYCEPAAYNMFMAALYIAAALMTIRSGGGNGGIYRVRHLGGRWDVHDYHASAWRRDNY